MDADGLPIVGPGIDYSKVDPIHQKRTLAFLNHFLIHTTSFLNHFAVVCDEKLEDLLLRIQRLEASMSILEAKLASIPGLEGVSPPSQPSSATAPEAPALPTESASTEKEEVSTAAPVSAQSEPVEASPAEPPKITVSQDPRFAKYFKMVNLGVPPGAVKIKMQTEGVDPDILDDPNQPAPPGAPTTQDEDKDADSESSDFSN